MNSNNSFCQELQEREERCERRLERPQKLKDQVKIAFPKKKEVKKQIFCVCPFGGL
jgi:hypothetical protein